MLYETRRWLAWNQPSNLQMMVLPLEAAMLHMKQHYGHSWPLTILIYEKDQVYWLNRWEELRSLGEKILDSLLLPGSMETFFDREFKSSTSSLIHAAMSAAASLKNRRLTTDELADLYRAFTDTYKAWYSVAWCAEPLQFAIEAVLSAELDRLVELNRIDGKDLVQGKVHLFSPNQRSFQADIEVSLAACCSAILDAAGIYDTEQVDLEKYLAEKYSVERADLFRSVVQERREFADAREKLQGHAAKYFWKRNNYLRTEELSASDIFHECMDLLNTKGIGALNVEVEHLLTVFSSENDLRSRLLDALEPYHRTLVEILSHNALLKDARKEAIQRVNHVISMFMDALCLRVGALDRAMALQLLPAEVDDVLRHGLTSALVETLDERSTNAVVFWGEKDTAPLEYTSLLNLRSSANSTYPPLTDWAMNGPTVAEGAVARHLLSALNGKFRFVLDMEGRIAGSTVYGDTIFFDERNPRFIGVARVLLTPDKGQEFRENDILIAPSTTPDYLEYIRKAGCLITDWGGWTSHAAIVARELRIPCVVGTQHASKVFRNGDKLEVDFLQGMARKLS